MDVRQGYTPHKTSTDNTIRHPRYLQVLLSANMMM